MSYSPLASHMVERRTAAKGVSLVEFTQSFDHVVDIQARSMVLLMVPLLALLLWALEWRKRRLFGEHLVFALHFYAFWLIFVSLVLFGGSLPVLVLMAHYGIHFSERVLDTAISGLGRRCWRFTFLRLSALSITIG